MLVLYPFEKEYFTVHGLKTTFTGHPIAFDNKYSSNNMVCLEVSNAHVAYAKVAQKFYPKDKFIPKISKLSSMPDNYLKSTNIRVDDFVVIEEDVIIENNVSIGTGSFIGKGVKIGANSTIGL